MSSGNENTGLFLSPGFLHFTVYIAHAFVTRNCKHFMSLEENDRKLNLFVQEAEKFTSTQNEETFKWKKGTIVLYIKGEHIINIQSLYTHFY